MAGELRWEPDVLGDGFESAVLQTLHPDGAYRIATLIRYRPGPRVPGGPGEVTGVNRQAVLFLHGWSDYFFNPELARFWSDLGIAFYALDMHNHGRSLRSGDMGGFVGNLRDYDPELQRALDAVVEDLRTGSGEVTAHATPDGPVPAEPRIALMGHSTGGLVAALWASRHPGTVSHLVLNSPWLEMHGSAVVRYAAGSLVGPLASRWPRMRMHLPERNFYWRSISSRAGGEWDLDDELRPPKAFPIRLGWMSAILAGQAAVAKGLQIGVPIVVLMSARSLNGPFWKEGMRAADAVLDIQTMAARAVTLGATVTVERIDGGLHDVLLSNRPVREDAYRRLERWVRGYMLTSQPERHGEQLS